MSEQIILTLHRLVKRYPPDRVVLDGITLSFLHGAKIGVLVLLAVTLAVQGGFVGFFLYLRKRAKRIADAELDIEWSKLQTSPRTS